MTKSRQELEKQIRIRLRRYKNGHASLEDATNVIIALIEPAIEAKYADRWISVEDELPKIGQKCICAKLVHHSEGYKEWWYGCTEYFDFGFPYASFPNQPNAGITHWKPISEPPKD